MKKLQAFLETKTVLGTIAATVALALVLLLNLGLFSVLVYGGVLVLVKAEPLFRIFGLMLFALAFWQAAALFVGMKSPDPNTVIAPWG